MHPLYRLDAIAGFTSGRKRCDNRDRPAIGDAAVQMMRDMGAECARWGDLRLGGTVALAGHTLGNKHRPPWGRTASQVPAAPDHPPGGITIEGPLLLHSGTSRTASGPRRGRSGGGEVRPAERVVVASASRAGFGIQVDVRLAHTQLEQPLVKELHMAGDRPCHRTHSDRGQCQRGERCRSQRRGRKPRAGGLHQISGEAVGAASSLCAELCQSRAPRWRPPLPTVRSPSQGRGRGISRYVRLHRRPAS